MGGTLIITPHAGPVDTGFGCGGTLLGSRATSPFAVSPACGGVVAGWLFVVRPADCLRVWRVGGGGIVGSLRTAQWTRASLIFVV